MNSIIKLIPINVKNKNEYISLDPAHCSSNGTKNNNVPTMNNPVLIIGTIIDARMIDKTLFCL